MLMLLGTVTISATILSKLEEKNRQKEALNDIASVGGAASAASTATMMNNVQNIVAQVQSEKAQVSNMTAVDTAGVPHLDPFPVAEQEGPKYMTLRQQNRKCQNH